MWPYVYIAETVSFFWEVTFLIAKWYNVQTDRQELSIRILLVPNTSLMCKIKTQNKHSVMCFRNVPDVFPHSCGNLWINLPTWEISMQEDGFLLRFPQTLSEFSGRHEKFSRIWETFWSLIGIVHAYNATNRTGITIFASDSEI